MEQALELAGAGVLAGVVSVVASLASLVSYPALLAVGLPPLAANTTNTVALVLSAVGAAAGSRPELAGQRPLALRLSALTAVGGAAGAALLLLGPAGSFEVVVPWLVAGASLVLLLGPLWARRRRRAAATTPAVTADGGPVGGGPVGGGPVGGGPDGTRRGRGRLLRAAALAVAVYTGYFGAAGGVLQLAVLTALLDQPLARTIALKNVVSGVANAVAAVAFAVFAPVSWSAALPLGAGFLVGGRLGPLLVRRLPAAPLRVAVALAGLAVAVRLALQART